MGLPHECAAAFFRKRNNMKYDIIATQGRAKSAHVETVHGSIETPVFMNVGTVGAIKGVVSTDDLHVIGTQVELSNTYHLHVRTGDELIKNGWASQVHEVGSSHSDRFRWISGFQPCRYGSKDQRRRRYVPFPYRWPRDFHGTGGIDADSVEPGLDDCYGL